MMKHILLFLALIVFSQQSNNLDGMHPLGVGHKSNRYVDKLANLRIHIEKEAQEAASSIQEWLTPEFTYKLVLRSDDPQGSNTVHLNTDELRKLTIGQQIVLTQWKIYPHYGTLVLNELVPLPLRMTRAQGFLLSTLMREISFLMDPCMLLRTALIEHNFGKKILKKLQILFQNECASLQRLSELIPQLKELKDLSEHMSSLEFQEKLEKCQGDLQDCFFVLQYSCLFSDVIRYYARNNHYDVIKLFLEYGLNPNSPLSDDLYFDNNNSLLKIAVAQENFDTVLLLLTHQADALYSKEGPSPMIMSLNKLQGSHGLPKKVQDIHTILSLSVPEEALHQCECGVQCDVQFEEFKKHVISTLCRLYGTYFLEEIEDVNSTLLEVYRNCSQVSFSETKSSYIFTNILTKLKIREEENLQINNEIFDRTAHVLLGLLFVNLTKSDCYMPLYDTSDYELLVTHVNTWRSDFEKHFAGLICVDDILDDDFVRLRKKSYNQVLQYTQKTIEQLLNYGDQFSFHSVHMALTLFMIFSRLIESGGDILAEPIGTMLSMFEDNDIFVETQNDNLDNVTNSDDEIQNC